jgi:hypothetical protein
LGLLPYSNCVHYDVEPARRDEYHRFVGDGMVTGFAVEDGVALHFRRTRLAGVVSSRREGRAYRVQASADGVVETPLKVTYLGGEDAPLEQQADGAQSAAATSGRRTRRRVSLTDTPRGRARSSTSATAPALPA